MKAKLSNGQICEVRNTGEPALLYNGEYTPVIEDQTGDTYVQTDGMVLYFRIMFINDLLAVEEIPVFTLAELCQRLQVSYNPVNGILTITKADEILYRQPNMFEDDATNFETDNGQKWGIQLNEDSINVYSIDEVSGERNETPIEVKFQ